MSLLDAATKMISFSATKDPLKIAVPTGGPGRGEGPAQPKGDSPPTFAPIVTEAGPNGEKKGRKGGSTDSKSKSRGGFGVKFEEYGS